MKLRLCAAFAVVLLGAAACGGGGHNGGGTATGTPGVAFQQLRNALQQRLAGIGVNIGAVPQDVRNQILAQCSGLAQLADAKQVNDLCGAIQRAMGTGDYGLISQVIDQLKLLHPK